MCRVSYVVWKVKTAAFIVELVQNLLGSLPVQAAFHGDAVEKRRHLGPRSVPFKRQLPIDHHFGRIES